MECVNFLKNIVYFAVLATIITTCRGDDFESHMASKLKNLDLAYGEKMSSVERGELNIYRRIIQVSLHAKHLSAQERSGPKLLKLILSTKCTTGRTIKVDSAYVPASNEGEVSANSEDNGSVSDKNNIVMSQDESKHVINSIEDVSLTTKTYLAPSSTDNPYYIDDER